MRWSCVVLCGLVACLTANSAQLNYNVSLDTSGFAGTGTQPYFEFILSGVAGNTVTISNPSFTPLSGGGATTSSTIDLVSNTTTLGGDVFWLFSPGPSTTFSITSTDLANTISGFQNDVLQIFLEDPTQTPYTTNDAQGFDALFRLTLTGGADVPELYTLSSGPAAGSMISTSGVPAGPGGGTGAVPEPASATMLGLAGALLIAATLLTRRFRPQN